MFKKDLISLLISLALKVILCLPSDLHMGNKGTDKYIHIHIQV